MHANLHRIARLHCAHAAERVPVRIRLDDPSAVATLASGISAEVTVDTSQHPAPKLAAAE